MTNPLSSTTLCLAGPRLLTSCNPKVQFNEPMPPDATTSQHSEGLSR